MNDDNKNTPLGGSPDDTDSDTEALKSSDLGNNGNSNESVEKNETGEELEQIAQIFKEEYEKAKEERENAPDGDFYEDPSADISSHEYAYSDGPIPEDMLCSCCGEKCRDISEDEKNPYCADCRKMLLKHPYSAKSMLVFILTPLLVLGAVLYAMILFPYSVNIAHADMFERQGRISDALYEYNTVLSNSQTTFTSMRASRKMVELLYKTGQTSYVSTYYSNLSETLLKMPMYRYLTDINDKTNALNDAFSNCGAAVSDYVDQNTGEVIYDEAISALNAYEATLDANGEYYTYQKAAVSYYKYYMAYTANKSLEDAIAYLKVIKELIPKDMWMYGYTLGYAYARAGQLDEALEIRESMRKYDAGDPNAFVIEAAAYRVQREYDKALKACDDGLNKGIEEVAYTMRILRQKAIVFLLQDKAGEAVGLLKETYKDYLSIEICDTLAICAIAAGDTELYNEIAEIYSSQSKPIEFSDSVKAFEAGTLTAEQIFLEGVADVHL